MMFAVSGSAANLRLSIEIGSDPIAGSVSVDAEQPRGSPDFTVAIAGFGHIRMPCGIKCNTSWKGQAGRDRLDAIACPMPLPAPVTTATCPLNLPMHHLAFRADRLG